MESATSWRNEEWRNEKSGGLREEGGDEGGGRRRVRVEHMASVHVEHSTTFPRLGWQTFRGSRGKCLPAKDGFVRMPMPPFSPLSLSPFHPPPDGLIGRRETRKVREREVQNCDRSSWSTRLLLRNCVDIPTVMSYVKLSPTFRSRIPAHTYPHTCFQGCGRNG